MIEKATVLNNIKSKTDEIKQYTKSTIRPIPQNSRISQKFNQPITKIIYMGGSIDKLAFYEEQSSEIQFMSPETGVMNPKTLKVIPKPLVVKISTVSKDKETGAIKVTKRDESIK